MKYLCNEVLDFFITSTYKIVAGGLISFVAIVWDVTQPSRPSHTPLALHDMQKQMEYRSLDMQ